MDNRTFSQRNGFAPLPSQLQLGELSAELRALLWAAAYKDFRVCVKDYETRIVDGRWLEILRDHFVRVRHGMVDEFTRYASGHEAWLRGEFEHGSLPELFDLVEFLLRHREISERFRSEAARAFVDAKAAYRVFDGSTIVPVGNTQQAAAIEAAIAAAEAGEAQGVRAHLLRAGEQLRRGDWAASIRDSIHAVEAVATMLEPKKSDLAAALAVLEKNGHLHGALKAAFLKLYGFASDEAGVRHALVFSAEAQVDETDALFMLGACASFVTYLLSRQREARSVGDA